MSPLVLIGFFLLSGAKAAGDAPPKDPSELEWEIRKSDYLIDWKYQAGSYLIYDCQRAYYACVNSDGFENCQDERLQSIQKKEKSYPCAPLRKFSNKTECVKENYKVVDRSAKKRFCFPK